jgi:hypothetical protein
LGFAEASGEISNRGPFDLLVLGQTLPTKDKSALIELAREHCRCLVLSIRRYGDPPHPNADYSVESQRGPLALIEAVRDVLKSA